MLINYFIYFHIGVCILLIVFEICWGLYARIRDIRIREVTKKYEIELQKQIESLSKEELIHKKEINVDNVVPKTVTPTQKMSQETVARNNIRIQQSKPGENLACWPKILKELKESGKIMLYTNLMNTTAKEINDMTVGIIFSKEMTPFGQTILEKAENQTELERKVSMELGKTMQIKYIENRHEKTVVEQGSTTIENFAENLDLPIHIIE